MAEAPALTIRRHFARPSAAQLAALAEVPTGYVVDAQMRRGALDSGIRPLTRAQRIVGVALPIWAGPRDNLAPWASLDVARPGDVMVVATGDHAGASVVGDLMVGMARNKGVVGVVTDGLVRDLLGLEATGVPVFARGLSPNSPWKNGPGEIGLPVAVGGMTVEAGDVIVADQDGVVVIPLARLDAVLAALDDVRDKEAKAEAAIRAGATIPGWLAEAMRVKGVREVD